MFESVWTGEVLCGGVEGNIAAWTNAVLESGIDAAALLRLVLAWWLNRRTFPSVADTLSFGQLVTAVCNIAGIHPQSWQFSHFVIIFIVRQNKFAWSN